MTRRRRRRDDASPGGIGDVLGAARRGMGISVERAAAATHLRESYLAALERDDVTALGLDPIYVRATLRTYADYLGLDSESLLARHRADAGPDEASGTPVVARVGASTSEPVAGGAADRPTPRRVLGATAGVIGLLVIAVVAFSLGETLARRMARSAPSGAVAAMPSAAGDDAAVLSRSGAASEVPATPPSRSDGASQVPAAPLELRLAVVEPTWVRVVTDGTTALVGRADRSVEEFHADRRITVRVAVAGAVKLTFNGERYGRMARNRDGPVKIACDVDAGCEVVK
jgi:cytoskeleton protein RodZ